MVTVERQGTSDWYIWTGTPGPEAIQGYSRQDNWIYGEGGDDVLRVGRATEGNRLFGGEGNDELIGSLGNDRLYGDTGINTLRGGLGDDIYVIDSFNDVIVERARWAPVFNGDIVDSSIDYDLTGIAVENLILRNNKPLALAGTGNDLNNIIFGNEFDNILDGGRGIDTLEGRDGDDIYLLRHKQDVAKEGPNGDGGGHDTIWAFNSYQTPWMVEDIILQEVLNKHGVAVQGLSAIGNNLDNLVRGNAADNNLNGLHGHDTLTGGAGADDFIFSAAWRADSVDRITDFAPGEDRIVVHQRLVNVDPGVLDDTAFHLGAAATTADHRFVFDGTTLRYDSDGSGSGAAFDIANFDGVPTLTADDIFIV